MQESTLAHYLSIIAKAVEEQRQALLVLAAYLNESDLKTPIPKKDNK